MSMLQRREFGFGGLRDGTDHQSNLKRLRPSMPRQVWQKAIFNLTQHFTSQKHMDYHEGMQY